MRYAFTFGKETFVLHRWADAAEGSDCYAMAQALDVLMLFQRKECAVVGDDVGVVRTRKAQHQLSRAAVARPRRSQRRRAF